MPNGGIGNIASFVALGGTALAVGAVVVQPPPPGAPLFPDGTLILASDGGARFIIDGGKLRFIRGPEVFTACGYNESALITVSNLVLVGIPRGADVAGFPCPFGRQEAPPPPPPPTPTPTPTPTPVLPTSEALTAEQVCTINRHWEQLLVIFRGFTTITVPVWTNTPTRPNQLTIWRQRDLVDCSGFSMQQILAHAAERRILVEMADGCGPAAFGLMFVPNICKVTPTPTPEWHLPPVQPQPEASTAAINAVFEPLGVAATMLCIANCESTLDPTVWNGGCCYGLFQIGTIHNDGLVVAGIIRQWDDLMDPLVNAEAARWLFERSGFSPWDCAPRCLG